MRLAFKLHLLFYIGLSSLQNSSAEIGQENLEFSEAEYSKHSQEDDARLLYIKYCIQDKF